MTPDFVLASVCPSCLSPAQVEVTFDHVSDAPRQRVLCMPCAMPAGTADPVGFEFPDLGELGLEYPEAFT